MATAGRKKAGKKVRRVRYTHLHKITAGMSLLAFVVMLVAGMMAEVPLITTVFRACLAIVLLGVVSRVLIRVLATYEEINSSQI